MKKTFITLLALAGIASAATSITLPEASDFTWIKGNTLSVTETVPAPTEEDPDATKDVTHSITSKDVNQPIAAGNIGKLAAAVTDMTGWFGGTGQGHTQTDIYDGNVYGEDISIISSTSFSFKSRPALSGEYVALGVTLTEAADSITLTFDTTGKLGYSLWSYDATTSTATELVGLTYQGASGSVSQTYNTDTVEASQLFVVWTANHPTGNAGGGATVTVSNIGLSYTAAPPVPEPATATLSLLALAGLAARRRRH